jgi:L-histidine Nalpha-methyltransferase
MVPSEQHHVPHGSVLQSQLAIDVRQGLSARPRSLPPKWFYDATGSALFDRICELPEYYLTRAERSILERDAEAIVGDATELLEIGSGMARKTGLLLSAMVRPRYLPFDISREAIEASARSLRAVVPSVVIDPVLGDFERDAERIPPSSGKRIWAFLGSTIGNLDQREAPRILRTFADRMHSSDAFLLGVDLVKDVDVLNRAYNDSAGVTEAFNKNVLAVINRDLDADFDLDRFLHRAHYNVERARIEMHLESTVAQRVRIGALDMNVDFDRGETILTEISRKFTQETVQSTFAEAGLRLQQWFSGDGFALALAVKS